MSGFNSLLFLVSSAIVLTASAFLVVIIAAGIFIGWTGGLGQPFAIGQRVMAISFFVFSLVILAVPVAIVRDRLQNRNPRPWLAITAAFLVVSACGFGLVSLLLDPSDFLWSGLPLMLFAGGLAIMTITLRRSF